MTYGRVVVVPIILHVSRTYLLMFIIHSGRVAAAAAGRPSSATVKTQRKNAYVNNRYSLPSPRAG